MGSTLGARYPVVYGDPRHTCGVLQSTIQIVGHEPDESFDKFVVVETSRRLVELLLTRIYGPHVSGQAAATLFLRSLGRGQFGSPELGHGLPDRQAGGADDA